MIDRAKILVIDDSIEMRNVLCRLLRKDSRFEVVEEGGDCQDFRVWPGIMGNKESHYVTTQRTCHTE